MFRNIGTMKTLSLYVNEANWFVLLLVYSAVQKSWVTILTVLYESFKNKKDT